MIVRRPDETARFVTSDLSRVVEVFHPDREALPEGMACSIAHARVAAGAATVPHTLATSTEIYWVLSGRGRMHIGDETADIPSSGSKPRTARSSSFCASSRRRGARRTTGGDDSIPDAVIS